MRFFIFLAVLFEFSMAKAATESKEFESATVKRINVVNLSGTIKITGEDVQKILVSVEKVRFDSQCELSIQQDGDFVSVKVERDNFSGSGNCESNVTIQVNKEVALTLSNGSGNIDVSGTKGKLEYQVGRGDVKVDAEVSELSGKSGNGATDVKGLSGSAKLRTGLGDINLRYGGMPSVGEIDIKSGSGDTTLFLPPDLKILTSVTQGKGGVTNDLGDDLNAKFKVSFKTGTGDLTIRKVPNQSF